MNFIKVIRDESSLHDILNTDDFKVSYVNLNNYLDLIETPNYQDFNFTVDSSRIASFLACDALMPDFSGYMCQLIETSKKLLFIGGSKEEASLFEIAIKKRFPEKFIKVYDGYNSFDYYREVHGEFSPDTVVCSMGFPLQENLILYLSEYSSAPCKYLACGAFISQTARNAVGYPPLIIRLNLRWLYRLINEKNARKRAIKILYNYLRLYGKKGSCFRHSIRF